MIGNRMERMTYILFHLAFFIYFDPYFKTNLFLPLISFISKTSLTVKESQTILTVLVITFLAGCALLTLKKNRNFIHIFINVSLPYSIYMVFETYPYVPKWLIVYLCFCLGCIVYCGICILQRPIAEGANKKRVFKARCKRFGNSVYMVAGLFSLCLSCVFVVGNIFDQSFGRHGRIATYNIERENMSSILDHEEELSVLNNDKWAAASQTEKLLCLESVVQIETAYLGLPHEVFLSVSDLDEGTLGKYNQYYQEITIDSMHLLNDTAMDCLGTILHEMYHSYQHVLCDVYGDIPQQYRNLLNLREASNYIYEFTKYEAGDDDIIAYAIQQSEFDARQYAINRAAHYNELLHINN